MRSLRRSQRAKNTSYEVGDAVEVMQGDGVYFKGKITREADASTPTHPLWIVSLRDGRRRNKEVSERSLRKLVEDDDAAAETTKTRVPRSKKEKLARTGNTKVSSSTSSSDPDDKPSGIDSNAEKSSLSRKTSGKKRRGRPDAGTTAKKQKTVSFRGQMKNRQGTQRVSTRSSSRNDPEKKFAVLSSHYKAPRKGVSKKGGARPKANKNEEVVKVKMLTGTLYLYRGEHRRAEFIRFF